MIERGIVDTSTPALLWPVPSVPKGKYSSHFGMRTLNGKTDMHRGVDIAGNGLDIIAVKSGTVTLHNPNSSSAGNYLIITHDDGTAARYLHMIRNSNTVTKGDKVRAGQVIGKTGSTGQVTGPHLHFEYHLNANLTNSGDNSSAVDPDAYFSSNPSSQVNNLSDYGQDTSLYEGGYVPYNPTEVSAMLASSILGSDPMCAYYKIIIGTKELIYDNNRPNIYQSFEINRLDGAGSTAQFTIFDDNWDELESYLSANWREIYLVYGYSSGISSPAYKMLLQDYSIDFNDTGTILSVKAISEGIFDNLQVEIAFDTKTKNPTEAIKAICKYKGWKVDDSNFVATETVEDREENYILRGDNPITYIMNVIIPEARTSDNEILTFYLSADKENTAHLVLRSYGVSDRAKTSNVRTYVYQKGYDSVVLSLSFNINGIFGGTSNLRVTTGLEGSVFGRYDKQEHHAKEDVETVITAATGLYSHTMARQSIPRFTTSGESPTQLDNKLFYYIKNATTSQYEATMVIIGDPTIELFEDIRIINVTDAGFLHHTSGIYVVKGISDSIENGEYRTTLKLQRNGDINEGVVLRNPRVNVK